MLQSELNVSHVMKANVVSIDSEASVKDAASKMVQLGTGSLVVTEQEARRVGIITETDLLSGEEDKGRLTPDRNTRETSLIDEPVTAIPRIDLAGPELFPYPQRISGTHCLS
jgi:signal-transduction protein with cAMP-binding, CBS, and nucleotidyltransferase domain